MEIWEEEELCICLLIGNEYYKRTLNTGKDWLILIVINRFLYSSLESQW